MQSRHPALLLLLAGLLIAATATGCPKGGEKAKEGASDGASEATEATDDAPAIDAPMPDEAAAPAVPAVPAIPDGWTTHSAAGVTFATPADWQVSSPPPEGCEIAVMSPAASAEDLFQENVNLVLEGIPAGYTEEDYFTAMTDQLKSVAQYQEIGRTTFMRGAYKGLSLEYSAKFFDAFLSHNTVTVIASPTQAHLITCSSNDAEFATWKPIFTQINETVSLQ